MTQSAPPKGRAAKQPRLRMSNVILPGRTVGILGGGQLGRMFAIAARRMGYRVHAFDPTPDCPAGQVADVEVIAAYDDLDAARALRRATSMSSPSSSRTSRPRRCGPSPSCGPSTPSPDVLHVCRHRLREKDFLSGHGFPVAAVSRRRTARRSCARRSASSARRRSSRRPTSATTARVRSRHRSARGRGRGVAKLGRPVGVLEAFVPFDKEVSVICARGGDGADRLLRPGRERPSPPHPRRDDGARRHLAALVATSASSWRRAIAETLDVVGLLAVEMFVVGERAARQRTGAAAAQLGALHRSTPA